MPKTAKVTPFTYSVDCPHCGAAQAEPDNGMLTWEYSQLNGSVRECFDCGKEFKLPNKAG